MWPKSDDAKRRHQLLKGNRSSAIWHFKCNDVTIRTVTYGKLSIDVILSLWILSTRHISSYYADTQWFNWAITNLPNAFCQVKAIHFKCRMTSLGMFFHTSMCICGTALPQIGRLVLQSNRRLSLIQAQTFLRRVSKFWFGSPEFYCLPRLHLCIPML